MSLRSFLEQIEHEGSLVRIPQEVDPHLEAARILKEKDGRVVLFEKLKGSDFRAVGGVCSRREYFARALDLSPGELLQHIARAIDNPSEPAVTEVAPFREVVRKEVDLSLLPVFTHTSRDMGPYITAGVLVSSDPGGRLNLSFHRASPIDKDRLAARICHRDTWRNLNKWGGEMPVALCLGLDPSVLLAASISAGDICELHIANALKPLEVVRCLESDLFVPAQCEIVLEGILSAKERHPEGPFPDITGTYDIVRNEPVIRITKITHRKDAIYQALLPASREHRLLMGMPKEPTIFRAVNRVVRCTGVVLTPGGCSWLHAVVQIDKQHPEDGMRACEAAFQAHGSLKHCIAVDGDVDINDPNSVEWAVATRVQADRDVKIWRGPGSSLDASAEPAEGSDRLITAKVAVDATVPWNKDRGLFERAELGT